LILIEDFIKGFSHLFPGNANQLPWNITNALNIILEKLISQLGGDYIIKNNIAVHKSATIESGVILKSPVIISSNCFIGANAYLRNGVYLGESSSIGPSSEIKTSIIFNHTEIAHLNFIADSIIGSNINFEAGSITANYFNERMDKTIYITYKSETIKTGIIKFGSLVGDNSKIGAGAVLSPGTILEPGTIVKRLELIDQTINTIVG
jgi:NDP-sugar pyrophosphorylase family protein